jgi:hypothetical protein
MKQVREKGVIKGRFFFPFWYDTGRKQGGEGEARGEFDSQKRLQIGREDFLHTSYPLASLLLNTLLKNRNYNLATLDQL